MSATLALRLRALAKYEPVFAAPGFTMGRWDGGATDDDGVLHLPWYGYNEVARGFMVDAAGAGWVVAFDWMRWAATPRGRALRSDPALVAGASVADLERLLTSIIRGDRFSEGEIVGAFESGLLLAIVRRAAELAEQLPGAGP